MYLALMLLLEVSMTVSSKRIEDAKAVVLERMADEPWLKGIGIGLVADGPGIVVSVEPSGEHAARAILSEISIDVPARIQVLGPIRKRRVR
jgi:hypothetical protein